MGELKLFESEEFGEVRVLQEQDQAWFVASDICKILDIKNATQAIKKLDEDERSMLNIGRQGKANVVNEYGLYSLIIGSRKGEAKAFKRWITHEVIPTIRKHGAYMTPEVIEKTLINPDFIIQLANQLKDEQARRQQAELTIVENKPKVDFANAVTESSSMISINDLAKLLKQNEVDTGQQRLFNWLREHGYLIKRQGFSYNTPTQRSMEMELFRVKESVIERSNGTPLVNKTTLVTGKGQIFFINKFKGKIKVVK